MGWRRTDHEQRGRQVAAEEAAWAAEHHSPFIDSSPAEQGTSSLSHGTGKKAERESPGSNTKRYYLFAVIVIDLLVIGGLLYYFLIR